MKSRLIELTASESLPDPLNPRSAIDWERIDEEIKPSMQARGFLAGESIEVRKIPVEEYRKALAASNRRADPRWARNVAIEFLPQSGDVYVVVDGEHRWHAAAELGIPILATVTEGDDRDADTIAADQFIANTGKGWNLDEEFLLVKRWVQNGRDAGWIKATTGRPQNWIEVRVESAWLPDDVLSMLGRGAKELKVRDVSALNRLKKTIGSRNIPDEQTAIEFARDIVSRWEASQYSEDKDKRLEVPKLVDVALQDADQVFLLKNDARPDPEEIHVRKTGTRLQQYVNQTARLHGQLRKAMEDWRRQHPDTPIKAFFDRVASRGYGSVKRLLNVLNASTIDAGALVAELCAAGYTHEACELCVAHEDGADGATRIDSQAMARAEEALENVIDDHRNTELQRELKNAWNAVKVIGPDFYRTVEKYIDEAKPNVLPVLTAVDARWISPLAANRWEALKMAQDAKRDAASEKSAAKKPARKDKPAKKQDKNAAKKDDKKPETASMTNGRPAGQLVSMQLLNPETCRVSERGPREGQYDLVVFGETLVIGDVVRGKINLPDNLPRSEKKLLVLSITYDYEGTRYTHAFKRQPTLTTGSTISTIQDVRHTAKSGFIS